MNDPTAKIWQDFADLLDEVIPFKGIEVPQYLIDRFDEYAGNEPGTTLRIRFTVDKDFEITEESLWDLIVNWNESPKTQLDFGDETWVNDPPITGRKKINLDEI